jgi:hypothetical protein
MGSVRWRGVGVNVNLYQLTEIHIDVNNTKIVMRTRVQFVHLSISVYWFTLHFVIMLDLHHTLSNIARIKYAKACAIYVTLSIK